MGCSRQGSRGLVAGLLNGRELRVRFHFSLITTCGIFCWLSLVCGQTASQKDLTDFESLSLVGTVLFVETEIHSFVKVLVVSYQNFHLSQCNVSLLPPHLLWPCSDLSFCSLLPTITWLLVAPLGSTQEERHGWSGARLSLYIISLCCWQFSLGY